MSFSLLNEPFFSFNDIDQIFDEAFGLFDRPARGSRRAIDQGQGRQRQLTQQQEGQTQVGFRPKLDIRETPNNEVVATFELPGLRKEDVKIDLEGNRLIISGEAKFEEDKNENGWVVKERRRGNFYRAVPVPQGTKPEQIKANLQDGVLTVVFPKLSPEQERKTITIN